MKLPKNEILWVTIVDSNDNITHMILPDQYRSVYKLYKVVDGKLIYTKHKSSDPTELEKWIKKE